MSLVNFLLERLDDDERATKGALHDYGVPDAEVPARVEVIRRTLREVQLKRQILALHLGEHDCPKGDREWVGGEDCSTLRLLALPYKGQPGYDNDWLDYWGDPDDPTDSTVDDR